MSTRYVHWPHCPSSPHLTTFFPKIPLNSALMACGGISLLFVTVLVYHLYFNAEDEQGAF